MTGTPDPNLSLPDDGRRNCNPPGVGFWALFWHRFGNWLMGLRPRPRRIPLSMLYKIMSKRCEWFCGTMLPYTVQVGHQARFDHLGA